MVSVSVIIPTYNRASVLPRAVQSVLNQTFQDFEIVIVDDGSTDETRDVIESFTDRRIESIHFSNNKGANAARNAGIQAANGEYIAFLDADDEWRPQKLKRQRNVFKDASKSIGLVYTGIVRKGTDDEIISRSCPEREGKVLAPLLKGNFIGTFSSVMVKSEVTDEIRLNEELPSWQDWDFYLEVAKDWEVLPVSEPLVVKYSARKDRISKCFEQKQKISYPILKNKIRALSAKSTHISTQQAEAALAFHLGYNALTNEYYSEARQYFSYALRRNPFQGRTWIYLAVSVGGNRVYKPLRKIKRVATS